MILFNPVMLVSSLLILPKNALSFNHHYRPFVGSKAIHRTASIQNTGTLSVSQPSGHRASSTRLDSKRYNRISSSIKGYTVGRYHQPELRYYAIPFSTQVTDKPEADDEDDEEMNMNESDDVSSADKTITYPKFQTIQELHPGLQSNLQQLKLTTMTEIQYKTWAHASIGRDVLGRARTGTGKTVAFLLPAIQQLLISSSNTEQTNNINNKNQKIQMLVLSPTRELAAQIHDQGLKLTRSMNDVISHHVMFGGNSKNNDIKYIESRVPTILVSTPGRIKDHIENTLLFDGTKSFKSLLSQVKVLVLDETDRLLDMGFKRDVEAIISHIPAKEKRQTLLFSATIPNEVQSVIRSTMRSDYVTIDCIHDTDPSSHTNAQVSQTHVIVPVDERMVSGTVDILCKLIADTKSAKEPLKLVVFFNTAHLVAFYTALFNALPKHLVHYLPIYELHSRKSQAFRTRTALAFKNDKEAILFTSDVSARGVDYPGVTDVVQFGIPDTRESYIHRLGRTGRAGKQGEGLIVLTNMEEKFLQQLKGLDVPVNEVYQSVIDSPPSIPDLEPLLTSIGNGRDEDLAASAASAYRSMIGFYNGKLKNFGYPGAEPLIHFANHFATQVGFKVLPEIEMQTIKKMGLPNYVGLNVVYKATNRGGGGGGGRGDGGGRNGPGRGRGRGGRSGRGDGGGASNRYMSTDASVARVPMSSPKRAMTEQDSARRDNQSSGANSKKKVKSDTADEGAAAKTNRRRRAKVPTATL